MIKMGIIKQGKIDIDGKIISVKVFGYKKDGRFVADETYLSEKDLINSGMWKHKTNWEEEFA